MNEDYFVLNIPLFVDMSKRMNNNSATNDLPNMNLNNSMFNNPVSTMIYYWKVNFVMNDTETRPHYMIHTLNNPNKYKNVSRIKKLLLFGNNSRVLSIYNFTNKEENDKLLFIDLGAKVNWLWQMINGFAKIYWKNKMRFYEVKFCLCPEKYMALKGLSFARKRAYKDKNMFESFSSFTIARALRKFGYNTCQIHPPASVWSFKNESLREVVDYSRNYRTSKDKDKDKNLNLTRNSNGNICKLNEMDNILNHNYSMQLLRWQSREYDKETAKDRYDVDCSRWFSHIDDENCDTHGTRDVNFDHFNSFGFSCDIIRNDEKLLQHVVECDYCGNFDIDPVYFIKCGGCDMKHYCGKLCLYMHWIIDNSSFTHRLIKCQLQHASMTQKPNMHRVVTANKLKLSKIVPFNENDREIWWLRSSYPNYNGNNTNASNAKTNGVAQSAKREENDTKSESVNKTTDSQVAGDNIDDIKNNDDTTLVNENKINENVYSNVLSDCSSFDSDEIRGFGGFSSGIDSSDSSDDGINTNMQISKAIVSSSKEFEWSGHVTCRVTLYVGMI